MSASASFPRVRHITFSVLLACSCLSSCSLDLLAQQKPKAKPAVEVANKTTEGSNKSNAKAALAPSVYTDPMVAVRGSSMKRPASGLMAQNASAKVQPSLSSEPTTALPVSDPAQASNDIAAAVNQPTAVSANTNSLYSLANAQIAASEGVSAYAPVRNINPMAGSVFSAPARATDADTTPVKPGKADGLW